jgi:hypothetical protein
LFVYSIDESTVDTTLIESFWTSLLGERPLNIPEQESIRAGFASEEEEVEHEKLLDSMHCLYG